MERCRANTKREKGQVVVNTNDKNRRCNGDNRLYLPPLSSSSASPRQGPSEMAQEMGGTKHCFNIHKFQSRRCADISGGREAVRRANYARPDRRLGEPPSDDNKRQVPMPVSYTLLQQQFSQWETISFTQGVGKTCETKPASKTPSEYFFQTRHRLTMKPVTRVKFPEQAVTCDTR